MTKRARFSSIFIAGALLIGAAWGFFHDWEATESRSDEVPKRQPFSVQRESLGTVLSRIISHAEEYGWEDAEIPLRPGVSIEAASGEEAPPHNQKLVYQYHTAEGYLGLFVYHDQGKVDAAHLFWFFSHSKGVTELRQKFRFHTSLSSAGGTAMESWLNEADAP